MSAEQISHSPDIRKLMEAGYEVEIREGCLLVHSVPYLNSTGQITFGTLASKLELAGNRTARPNDHIAYFIGDHPYQKDGQILKAIRHTSNVMDLAPGIRINHSFSNKPVTGYVDYYEKMSRYIEIISSHAASLDKSVTAKTYRSTITSDVEEVFNYFDSASVRAGTTGPNEKLKQKKIGIIGLGGTGSYVLDLIAKTPVAEIHLFDGDQFLQHNAFRAPGAPGCEDIALQSMKVDYFGEIYDRMRKGIVRHPVYLAEQNIDVLSNLDFIFICVDKAKVRKLLVDSLVSFGIPFIDTGMGLNFSVEQEEIVGACRTTLWTPLKGDHIDRRIPMSGEAQDDVYNTNIQVADMNALNAAMAVIKWKKFMGFYHDGRGEYNSDFVIEFNQLNSQEEMDALQKYTPALC